MSSWRMEMLLERLRRREPAAFQEVVIRLASPLQRTLEHLLHDRTEAEDVVQESMARLFLNIDTVRSLRPWLYQVAMNLARNHLRRMKLPPPEPRPEAPPGDADLKELIDRALEELPEKTRSAFVLREVAGLTTEEVAQAEGCRADAVRQRITEARRKLRLKLAPHLRSLDFKGV